MGLSDKKPMQYTEIAEGNFHKMMQEAFLKAHKLASEYGQKVEVSANIAVFPPDPRSPQNGNLNFSVQLKEPKYTSQRYVTALVGGMPVQDGKNQAEAEQYDMFEIKENVTNKLEVVDGVEGSNDTRVSDATE